MDDSLGSRRVLAKGIDVGHDVVPDGLLALGRHREGLITDLEVGAHLVQGLGRDHFAAISPLQAQLPLAGGEVQPE